MDSISEDTGQLCIFSFGQAIEEQCLQELLVQVGKHTHSGIQSLDFGMFSENAFGVLSVVDEFGEILKRTVITTDQFAEGRFICAVLIIVFLDSPLSAAKLVVNLPGNLNILILRSAGVKNGKCICLCQCCDLL